MDKRRKKEEEKWKESVNKSLQSSMHGWERRSQTQLRMRVGVPVYTCTYIRCKVNSMGSKEWGLYVNPAQY